MFQTTNQSFSFFEVNSESPHPRGGIGGAPAGPKPVTCDTTVSATWQVGEKRGFNVGKHGTHPMNLIMGYLMNFNYIKN